MRVSSRLLILFVAVYSLPLLSAPDLKIGEFRRWFVEGYQGHLSLSSRDRAKGAAHHYIFITGFNSEKPSHYFWGNINQLLRLGVPARRIHLVKPPSEQTFKEYYPALKKHLFGLADPDHKLVLVAHSRGAEDALGFALLNPDFVRDNVALIFLVQGSFGGSGLADYVLGKGPTPDTRMGLIPRVLADWAGRLKAWQHQGAIQRGSIQELTREYSATFWHRMREETGTAAQLISDRVFYIQSWFDPNKQDAYHWVAGSYLEAYYGPNDGTISLEDQYLSWVGHRLLTLKVGHTDLTQEYPFSRASSRYRVALTSAVFTAACQKN
jgi:pimeloyl-ACP methyl ester carboxylesterase